MDTYLRTPLGSYQYHCKKQFSDQTECLFEEREIAILYSVEGQNVVMLKHGPAKRVEEYAKTLPPALGSFILVSGNSFHPLVLTHAINCSGYIPYWLDGYEVENPDQSRTILRSSNYIPPNPEGLFRVIVAGSREFTDYAFVKQKLDELLRNKFPYVEIVNGLAAGPDTLGGQWATERKVEQKQFPADWKAEPRRAGILRNMQMGDYAHALIAFWNGTSRGTKHMIEYAQSKGLNVKVIRVTT